MIDDRGQNIEVGNGNSASGLSERRLYEPEARGAKRAYAP
jgi:hypothetical protein